MSEIIPPRSEWFQGQRQGVFIGQVSVRSQSVEVVLALPDLERDAEGFASLSAIAFECITQSFRSTVAEHPLDRLRQPLYQVLRIVSCDDGQTRKKLTAAIVQGPYLAIGSTTPLAALRWNEHGIRGLNVRSERQGAVHTLALRNSPQNALIAMAPGSPTAALIETLKHQTTIEAFESSPDSCLDAIARSLPPAIGDASQILIGTSANVDRRRFSVARIPVSTSNDRNGCCSVTKLAAIEASLLKLQNTLERLSEATSLQDPSAEQLLQYVRDRDSQSIDHSVIVPLMQEQILLYDLLPAPEAEEDSSLATAVRSTLLNTMSLHGVEPFQMPGNQFDSKFQRCVGYEPTFDPHQNKLVAQRVRVGFRRHEKVLRHEEAVVFRYEIPVSNSGDHANGCHRN